MKNEGDLRIFFTNCKSNTVVPVVNRGNTTPEPNDLDEDISPIAPNCVKEKRVL
jgi:hypothetical protein